MMTASCIAPAVDFFDYQAERVALNGYRCAMAGYEYGDPGSWDALWDVIADDGGVACACHVMGSLQFFVRSLRSAVEGQGHYFPRSCRKVCRAECLVISLLAAHQTGLDPVRKFSLNALLGLDHGNNIALVDAAAAAWAQALVECNMRLMPVPLDVIQGILSCNGCAAHHQQRLNA